MYFYNQEYEFNSELCRSGALIDHRLPTSSWSRSSSSSHQASLLTRSRTCQYTLLSGRLPHRQAL